MRAERVLQRAVVKLAGLLVLQRLSLLPICAAARISRAPKEMVSRPGSKAARALFCKGTKHEWHAALRKYEATVKAVGKSRKKEKELVKWDRWLRIELPAALQARGCLSKDELAIVMNWKITRGTFRPLMNQLLSNSDKAAEEATKLALSRLQEAGSSESKIRAAIDAVCQLRGIGPATATAVLCSFVPNLIPFMSDEAIEGAGLDRKYTLDCCCELAKLLAAKASELGGEWNAELVGRAMWAEGLSQVHGVSPVQEGVNATSAVKATTDEAASTGKRKRVAKSDEGAKKKASLA